MSATFPAAAVVTSGDDVDRRVVAVVGEHYDFVWRLLRRLGVTEAEADDAAQQVFCVFAKRSPDVPQENVKTFLFGVVVRIAKSVRRSNARVREVLDEDAVSAAIALDSSPEDLVDDRRARDLLDAMLSALPIDYRTVFVLHEIEELTMAEIATVMSLPAGTVASRLRRARELFDQMSRRVRARHATRGGR